MTETTTAARQAGIPQGITVIIAGFLPILAIVSMFPAVPAIIGHFMPTDPSAGTKVPAMVTAPGLAIAVVALFAGYFVDKFGRRKLLLWSTFFYSIFGAIPFFLSDLDQIYASRLLLGITEAAILTTLNTLIADYWADQGRRNWLTLQGLVGPFLSSVMLFFAGTLVAWQWNGIFLIYLVSFPIWLAMLVWMFEPASDATARKALGIDEQGVGANGFPWDTMIGIGILTLISALLYYVFIVNGGLVWQELGVKDPESIGQITALPSLFILAGAGLFWWLGRRGASSRTQIGIFLLTLGSGLALIGIAQDWKGMILGMMVQQTGAGMAIPTLIAWAQKSLPFEHRGRGMGLWTACFFFGQWASPLVVSVIKGGGTMQAAFLLSGLIGIGCAVVAWLLLPRVATAPAAAG